MKITGKLLFPAIFYGLLFEAIFLQRAYATPPFGGNDVMAGCGWDMGACRIPNGPNSTDEVVFSTGEVIDMPIHINRQNDNPDIRDIYIYGSPVFTKRVEMGESRYTYGGDDKYASVMSCFEGGIYFDVPDAKITDEPAVQSQIDRFRDSTNPLYKFKPNGTADVPPMCSAVQLEFFVDPNHRGMVRITNHCTVKTNNPNYSDFRVVSGSGGTLFENYNIYAYHYARNPNDVNFQPHTCRITDTYVPQDFGGYEGDPAGQIFVNGSVIIGGADTVDINQIVKGKIAVIATGNIWIGDNIIVDGPRDANDMPTADNPNFLCLIAQGVIKVVDPGLSDSAASWVGDRNYPADTDKIHYYQPIGVKKYPSDQYNNRYLLDPTVVEAAITVGGGGWGAEHVAAYPGETGRKEYTSPWDTLIVRGAFAEVVRGIVGSVGSDGYSKHYYHDRRWCPECSEPILGDLNGDCVVDFEDVATMTFHWLENNLVEESCASPIKGDINNDCTVDFVDFAKLAEDWWPPTVGDFDKDGRVEMDDLETLAQYWLQNNPRIDIAPPGGDHIVNFLDYALFSANWLE